MPAALKIATGNAGKRPIPPEPEPDTFHVCPDPPEHLDAAGRDCWLRNAKVLFGMKLFTQADYDAMCLYCDAWSMYVKGRPRQKWPMGYRALVDTMHRYQSAFGFTPVSRTRVAIPVSPDIVGPRGIAPKPKIVRA